MRIAIIGCGNMGTAYARSFRKYGLVKADELLLVIRGAGRRQQLEHLGQVIDTVDERISSSELVIIAVKPQDFSGIAPSLSAVLRPGQVVLSIMAGITLQRLSEHLGHETVVRAMPNAPHADRHGYHRLRHWSRAEHAANAHGGAAAQLHRSRHAPGR